MLRSGNPQYPMALYYKEAKQGCCNTLKISDIEDIENSIRGADRLNWILQRQLFWIYTLKATQFTGLNGELDFLPFL